MGLRTANNLRTTRQMLEHGAADNLARLGDPTARKIDASINASNLGMSGTLIPTLSLTRATDPLLEKAQREQITKLESSNMVTSYLKSMQSALSGSDNSSEFVLVTSVNKFFAQAKKLESDSSAAMRLAFVNRGEELAKSVTNATGKGASLQLAADNQMKESVSGVNSTIKALFELNQKMRRTPYPIKTHDARDNLVNDLAKFMDIKVTPQASGSVLIQSTKDGTELVSGDYYAKFEYPGILSERNILSGYDHPPMMMTHYHNNNSSARAPVVFMGGSDDETQKFSSGQWGALVELRKNILPDLINTAKAVGRNIAKSVNDIHNNGSTFPPKTYFESSMTARGTESFDWKPFTIHAVDATGDQLRGASGLLNPVTIDMNKVKTESISGKATVADMIKEINEALHTAPSRDRAAIGAIRDGNGTQIPGQYLVNNMQLKSNGAVSGQNNSFTFELDLQGNSHFGSDIEVMSVVTADVGGANAQNLAADQLPGSFKLDKGENAATGMPITVDGFNVPKQVTVEVRVTGENGVVERGTITYVVNPDVATNDRIAINSATAAQAGDFVDPTTINRFGAVATAMLVDNNNIEIDLKTNPGATGKLVIQTTDDSYRLAIQGGLGSLFEFNNMFEFDEASGKMNVRADISEDVGQLAIGQAAKDNGTDTVHTVGDATAKSEIVFGATVFAPGDTVGVGGVVFNYNAAPGVGGLNFNNLNELTAAINTHPMIGGAVNATLAGTNLTITASKAGTSGNPNTVVGLAGALGGLAVNVQAGTDKVEVSKLYSYSIKPKSGEVLEAMSNLQSSLVNVEASGLMPATQVSLSNLATIFSGILSDKLNSADTESKISANVLEQMNSVLKEKFGINRDEQFIKAIEDGRLMQAMARLISMLNSVSTKAQDIMFGGG